MLVGPALILTTVVLACGLVVTVFSDLPSLRLFGWLSAFAMVAALVADLFILRPTAMFLINLSRPASRHATGHAKPVETNAAGATWGHCWLKAMTDAASALHHRDVDAADLALGADLNRLLVAGGPQCQVGGKSRRLDEHVDLAAARGALQIAEDVAAGFAPVAGNAVALAGDVAAEIEFVAVAGAMQSSASGRGRCR